MKLFTKTCAKDFDWLALTIRSIRHFAKEPLEWHMVIENSEMGQIHDRLKNLLEGIRLHAVESEWPDAMHIPNGYLRQQWIKMTAHRVMGKSLFYNWDSDIIAQNPFDTKSFQGKSGRPILWFSHYNHMIHTETNADARNAYILRKNLANAVYGWPINFEWMRCMPVPCWGEITESASTSHYWARFFNDCKAATPGFSEFNFIGEYAHMFFPDAYEYLNAEAFGPTWAGGFREPGKVCFQGWSWGGIPAEFREFVEALK